MARDEKKRQQKLMKKRQKKKRKKTRATGSAAANTEKAVIRRARRYPIHECLISGNWQESGIAAISVARRQSETIMAFGVYIVDLYCLGVKNTYCRADVPLSKYKGDFRAQFVERNEATACPAELAHQIIYGAVEYAANLGLRPHKDFHLSSHILEERDTIAPNDELEFGKDGKPLYVSGPYDSPGQILKHLEAKLGEGGFHYIIMGDSFGQDEGFEDW